MTKKYIHPKNYEINEKNLDEEEKEFVKGVKEGKFVKVELTQKERDEIVQKAKNTQQLRKSISIRMSESDLHQIRHLATKKGLPYQTLINSILHQYINGDLIEKN